MVAEGYLTRDGTLYSHTEAGEREARLITAAWGRWLADRVERDVGRASDAELRAAVDGIAKRVLAEDLAHDLPSRLAEGAPARG
jgi:hypothetical protein